MNFLNSRILIFGFGVIALIFGFQNCSKVQTSDVQLAVGSDKQSVSGTNSASGSPDSSNSSSSSNNSSGNSSDGSSSSSGSPDEIGVCNVIYNNQTVSSGDGHVHMSGDGHQHSDVDSDNDGQHKDCAGKDDDDKEHKVIKMSESNSEYKTACMSRAACENIAASLQSGSLTLPKDDSSGDAPASSAKFVPSSSDQCEADLDDKSVEKIGGHGECKKDD